MQSLLSAKPDDDPCDDLALTPDVAPGAPSEEELSSVLHMAARYRLDRHVTVAPEVTAAPMVEPADAIGRPVPRKDTPAAEDRAIPAVAPPIDAMVRPVPANDVGDPDERRRKVGLVGRTLLALVSTLIIGLGAATWKSYGDVATRVIGGFVTQPVVASSQPAQPEKPEVAPPPPTTEIRAEAATPAPDQPAPAAQAAPAPPASPATASPDQTQQLQAIARDLAALGQQVDNLKAEMAQMKASQQQASHNPATAAAPPARPKAAASPRPVAVQARRPIPPTQSYAPARAAAAQPAVPQVATAPYRSAPQAAAGPVTTNPYYAPPQRYVPPPPEPPPQATAEPIDQEYWAPRPPMPVR